MNQKTALEILKMGHNVFLTGPAGSGKTYLLNQYIQYLKDKRIEVAVTASTGIAATHMNGITVHSWSGMGIREKITDYDLKKIAKNRRIMKGIAKTKVLIIDEVSMLHAYQLDNVDLICRSLKEPFLPFGGLQVIDRRDFFQLPPVSKNEKGAKFAYVSESWQAMEIKVCYLDEQHRQKDDRLLKVLNQIRSKQVDDETLEIILSRENMDIEGAIKPTKLFTHNADVDAINNIELAKLKEKPFAYSMRAQGNRRLTEFLRKGCLAPEKLILKKGAQVMFVKNNFEKGYVNGTMGKIIGFDSESKMPIVKTFSGQKITALPATWEVDDNYEIVAQITQIPLRLAWAITVHKSQGMSLDAAEIDLRKSFEFGMGYVALSRVRALSGLKLLGVNETALEINSEIYEFDKELFAQSVKDEEEMRKTDWFSRRKKRKKFLDRNAQDKSHEKAYDVDEIRREHKNAYAPWSPEDDMKLLKFKDKSVPELAKMFGRKEGAIRSRLAKLLEI